MESDDYELKACPFCDGDAEVRTRGVVYFVRCADCGCRTGESRNVSKVIGTWNTRTEIDVDDAVYHVGGEYMRRLIESIDGRNTDE